tara:strand:- start:1980 stop:3233 length:1254 start_codon:yes stop_codon:yes gene_type:complete
MAAVYHNAYLVLGASCASSSSHSFLNPTMPSAPHKAIAEVENSDGSIAVVYARDCRPHGNLVGPRFSRSERIKNRPLATRGWTLQEQLLSRRMVHFEAEELFWECRTMMECECLELQDADEYKSTLETETSNGKFSLWHALVKQYHVRHLTVQSDFLPALSGIVTHIQNCGAGPNLAGLWQNHLLAELLWHAAPNSVRWQRASPYRAPTWSWASIDETRKDRSFNGYRISFWADEMGRPEPCYVSLTASTTPAGSDPHGRLSGGSLIIKAKVLKIRQTRPTGYRVPHGERNMELSNLSTGDVLHVAPACCVDVTEDDYTSMELYAVLLAHFPKWSEDVVLRENRQWHLLDDHWAGLILRRAGKEAVGNEDADVRMQYERVGSWIVRHDERYARKRAQSVVNPSCFFESISEIDIVVL